MPEAQEKAGSIFPGLAALAIVTLYMIAVLSAEKQAAVAGLFVLGAAIIFAAKLTGLLRPAVLSFREHEASLSRWAALALIIVAAIFRDDHFVLLIIITVMLYAVATLGLNIQFGYAGMVNFAGASFFGIGAYTSAVLNQGAIPSVAVPFIGGAVAALISAVLLPPMLRTRGHYAAVITIAFALLLKSFLEVSDVLGGPQGLQVPPMIIFGWTFTDNIQIGGAEISFYMSYFALSLLLLAAVLLLVRRLERSWIGLNLDALQFDETVASCFGTNGARWKSTAFLLGNFIIGVAGGLYAMVSGFVAPNNYTFADSLIFVSILLLGGIGNPWGVMVASAIAVILPEKLQAIHEYRFLLYAGTVMIILLFRPEGLLPRPVRRYF